MKISKKCQYALKAIFELAWRKTSEPVKIHSIARSQQIPPRFTEIILNDLKHAGFVDSIRGKEGGYLLAREAKEITIGEVIEHVQGPISFAPDATRDIPDLAFSGGQAFQEFWKEINIAFSKVCDNRTFADLVKYEEKNKKRSIPNYSI